MGHILKKLIVSIIASLLFSSVSLAATVDVNQKMNIVANSAFFDFKKGKNTYEGQVKVQQGNSILLADKVITESNAQHQMEIATAFGLQTPASYTTIPQSSTEELHAVAKIIKFYPKKSLVRLEGDVIVTQGKDTFRGPIIIYNIKEQIVSAPANKKGRATIVIEPAKFKS